MKKRIIALLLALAMMLAMVLTGCGSGNQSAAEEEPADEPAAAESAPEEDAAAEEPEPAEPAGAPEEAASDAQTLDVSALSAKLARPVGGLAEPVPVNEVEIITEEDASQIDRAMRAYIPSESLIINNAESFYYYAQLDEELQQLYDVMFMVAQDPVSENNYHIYLTGEDPSSDEFFYKMVTAYYAMVYDHPELFWLYNSSETDMCYSTTGDSSKLLYTVYFYLDHPVENFEEQQTAFNEAAEAFLADIDLSQSEGEIAKDIHDKLIDTVTYDDIVLENSLAEAQNLAHTAYGALVADSYGSPNYAVCDGYALAYEYLLQQAGLEAAFIGGKAGSTELDAGGHAWSMVKIDGEWYEVDATWDDNGSLEDALTPDINGYEYFMEALSDAEYREKLDHYLYGISTSDITNYEPDEAYYSYYTSDGLYVLMLVGSSVHIRDTEAETGPMGAVMALAPTAY